MLWRGRQRKKTRKELGEIAEDHAARYLRSKGYRVLERNYLAHGGEVDIVAEQGDALVFVEVKSRSSAEHASPRESVTPGKQRRIVKAASTYLASVQGRERLTRFDVVEVLITPQGRVENIVVIDGAFTA